VHYYSNSIILCLNVATSVYLFLSCCILCISYKCNCCVSVIYFGVLVSERARAEPEPPRVESRLAAGITSQQSEFLSYAPCCSGYRLLSCYSSHWIFVLKFMQIKLGVVRLELLMTLLSITPAKYFVATAASKAVSLRRFWTPTFSIWKSTLTM